MNYFHLRKKDDSRGFMICLIIFSFILLCKKIIDSGYLIYAIIIIVLSIIGGFAYKKVENIIKSRPVSLGDEFKKKYPIIMQYLPPKGINPAEAGLLYNLKVEPTDLTSLIYQWEYEGLIDIETFTGKNSNKNYIKLIKKSEMPLTRPLFETGIFDSIFVMGDIKIIEESFQLRYALMLEDLEEHGIRKGWIIRPSLSKKWEYIYKVLVALLSICILLILIDKVIVLSSFLRILFGILLFSCIFLGGYIYGGGKLRLTDKGAALASYLIGYRNFIKSCDENKIKLFLEEDPLFIDKTLPYATAFGMETEFLTKISPLKKDRNARYVRGKKVPGWTKILRALIGSKDGFWS